MVNRVVLLKPGLVHVGLSLFFSNPHEVASTRAFSSLSSSSYNESQGLTGGPGTGKTLCGWAPVARSSK
jgi:hypothetical protein